MFTSDYLKWSFDGCSSFAELIERCHELAEGFKKYKDNQVVMTDAVEDGWLHMETDNIKFGEENGFQHPEDEDEEFDEDDTDIYCPAAD